MKIEDFPITTPDGYTHKGILSKLTCDCGKEAFLTGIGSPCLTDLDSFALAQIRNCELKLQGYKRKCGGQLYCQKELATWQAFLEQLRSRKEVSNDRLS